MAVTTASNGGNCNELLRTLIFDLGGVIIPLDFPRAFAALAKLCPLTAEEIPQAIGDTGLVPLLETGQIDPEEFHRRISEALGLSLSIEDFRNIWTAAFLPGSLIPESLLESLHGKYRLLLLSNTNAIHFPLVESRYPHLRHFDDYVLSYEVGVMKPDPGIYREAIKRADGRASECVFVDDVEENVAGARSEGMDAFRFESAGQLIRELRRRGITV